MKDAAESEVTREYLHLEMLYTMRSVASVVPKDVNIGGSVAQRSVIQFNHSPLSRVWRFWQWRTIHRALLREEETPKTKTKARTPCFEIQREGRREMNDSKTAWEKSSPSVRQVTIDQIVHQREAIVQCQKCFKGKACCKSVQGRQN